MARQDCSSHRLYVSAALAAGVSIPLDPGQVNYIRNVLRLGVGASVLVFNGRDGEWRAQVAESGRKAGVLQALEQARPQPAARELTYLFAPLKHARHDYMVQKAVEMGASCLQPVLTQHTQAARVNLERMAANVIEAAEQCGVLAVPQIKPPVSLAAALSDRPAAHVVFCDEAAPVADPVTVLRAAAVAMAQERGADPPLAVLIGPEGGFDATERATILALPRVTRLSLGPRILRADTAAVAALALVQAVLGDWRGTP